MDFVDFCILCGCEYTNRIKNIETGITYKFIKFMEKLEYPLRYYQGC